MGIVIAGVVLIAGMLITTMAVPFVYYLKRDMRWMESDRSRQAWDAMP